MKTLKKLGLSESDSLDKANEMLSNMSLSELQSFERDLGQESNEDDKKKERLEILRKMTFGEWFASEYAGNWGSESFFDAPREKQREAMRKYMELFEEDANYEVDRESMIQVLMSFEKIEKTIAGLGFDESATPDDVQKALDAMSAEDLNKLYENVENDSVKPASEQGQTTAGAGSDTGSSAQPTGSASDSGAQPVGGTGSDSGAQPSGDGGAGAPTPEPISAKPESADAAPEPAQNSDSGSGEGEPLSTDSAEGDNTNYDELLRSYSKEKLPNSREEILAWTDKSVRGMRMRDVFGEESYVGKINDGLESWNGLSDDLKRAYLSSDFRAFAARSADFDNIAFLSSLGMLPDPSKL